MKRLLFLLCCLPLTVALAQTPKKTVPAPVKAPDKPTAPKAITPPADLSGKILPYPIHQKKLPNGLNVVTVPYPSPGVAAFYIIVRVGSRDEVEEGKSGFAHFFEHMMFRGTKRFSKEQYSGVLKSTGASANANTSLDRTVYHMTGDAKKLETMFDIEADRFMNLDYSEQDFRTEAGAVKGEYTKNSSNPYTKLNELIQNAAFDFHTYKHTTMGFLKDIIDMPNQYDYSKIFFERFYRPEYSTILVVGDVTPANVEQLAAKYFGKWATGEFRSAVSREPQQKGVRKAHLQKPGFPPYLSLNYKAPAYNDASNEVAALNVLSALLFSENSDLYDKLVVKEQKLRGMDAGIYPTRDPFLVSVEASLVNAADMQSIKDQLIAEIEKAKTVPADPKKLSEARQNIRNSFAMGIDNPTSIAEALSNSIWLTGDPETLNRYYAQYEKVTAQDVMNVAKKYFIADQLTIGTISPNETENLR